MRISREMDEGRRKATEECQKEIRAMEANIKLEEENKNLREAIKRAKEENMWLQDKINRKLQ